MGGVHNKSGQRLRPLRSRLVWKKRLVWCNTCGLRLLELLAMQGPSALGQLGYFAAKKPQVGGS
eukprot:351244-Chlamydomonas_euryale.AAC.2